MGWGDFPVVILGWWLDAARRVLFDSEAQAKCSFMDGPYYFIVSAQPDDGVGIDFFKSSVDGEHLLREGRFEKAVVAAGFLSAANLVSKACKANGWSGTDLSALSQECVGFDSRIHTL